MSLFCQMKMVIKIFSPIKLLIILLIWNIVFEKLLVNFQIGHKDIKKYKKNPTTQKLYTVRQSINMRDLDILAPNFEDAITELSKDMDKEFEEMFEKEET